MATPSSAALPTARLRRGPRLRVVLAVIAAGTLLAGAALWLRDSPLVSIDQVTVTGATGPTRGSIEGALTDAARGMSTLHVDVGRLQAAVAAFPIVASVEIHTHFPHKAVVIVHQRTPVAAITLAGTPIAVDAQGTLLRATPTAGLTMLSGSGAPSNGVLTDPARLRDLALLAAAPAGLRRAVTSVGAGPGGLVLQLRDGPQARFGDRTRTAAKWLALRRVLADPASQGAAYIDVRVPERPAAGGFPAAATDGSADPAVTDGTTDGTDTTGDTGVVQ